MGAASAREIAEHYDIPIELLAKILQRLARRGLLTSHQGTRGGYSLARPATVISVADVIQAVDGPLTVTACSVHDQGCGQYSKCNVRDPLWRIKDRILTSLAACSLDEIATDVPMTSVGAELQPVTFAPRARVKHFYLSPVLSRAGAGRPLGGRAAIRRAGRAAAHPRAAERAVTSEKIDVPPSTLLYFDGHATTPVRSAGRRGDAAVLHRALRQRVERAASLRLGGARGGRARARAGRGADRRRPRDVVFTSGATESNNLAIAGAVRALRAAGATS